MNPIIYSTLYEKLILPNKYNIEIPKIKIPIIKEILKEPTVKYNSNNKISHIHFDVYQDINQIYSNIYNDIPILEKILSSDQIYQITEYQTKSIQLIINIIKAEIKKTNRELDDYIKKISEKNDKIMKESIIKIEELTGKITNIKQTNQNLRSEIDNKLMKLIN